MNETEIRDYLENNLKSHKDNIMDNNDRLVWITDVTDVVINLVSQLSTPLERAQKINLKRHGI
jgi:hypothetical protein